MPSMTSGSANRVPGWSTAMRYRQASASSTPPPMQKPFTSASVGKGRAASLLYRSQPRFTMRIASSASLILVNSSTSAPATNPDSFAERMTSPRGFCPASSSTMPSSSAITSAESTFVEAPALSIESQTIPSPSVSSFQLR